MRPPAIRLRTDEYEAGGRRVRAELRQEAEFQEAGGGPPGPASRARSFGPGGYRPGPGP